MAARMVQGKLMEDEDAEGKGRLGKAMGNFLGW